MAPRSRFDSVVSLIIIGASMFAAASERVDFAVYLVLLAVWVSMPAARAKDEL